jgi:hypothetical protein
MTVSGPDSDIGSPGFGPNHLWRALSTQLRPAAVAFALGEAIAGRTTGTRDSNGTVRD